jgi:hypothetical protein
MTQTVLSDIIVPEVFADYVTVKTAELSALYQSGVAVSDPVIAARAAGGGAFVNLPFFNDLTGDDQVMSDAGEMDINAITALDDVAVKCFRENAWGSTDLVRSLAGADPIQSLANRVADYWARKEQKALINTLEGVFATALASTHVLNLGATSGGSILTADVVLDAKQKLGDSGSSIVAIAMHSVTFTGLQKANLIATIPASQGNVGFSTYLGYRVIIDDACPVVSIPDDPAHALDADPHHNTYASYLFAAGAVAHVEVAQPNAIEFARYATKNQDVMISRSAYISHVRGVKWNVTTVNPTNAQLATGSNWAKVYADKQIRVVKVITK